MNAVFQRRAKRSLGASWVAVVVVYACGSDAEITAGTTAAMGGNATVTSASQGGAGVVPSVCPPATWSKAHGSFATAFEIIADRADDLIVVGDFADVLDLGGDPLLAPGSADIFVAKFSSEGEHLFSRSFGDSANQSAYDVDAEPSGGFVVTGVFEGVLDFDSGPLASVGVDAYVAKFDASGLAVWSRTFGVNGVQYGNGSAVDASGNVVVVGTFSGFADFGGGVLQSAGDSDVFVAKLDGAGNHQWSKRFGDAGIQGALEAETDRAGNVYVTGGVEGTIDFGGGPMTASSLSAFVAKLDPTGAHVWSKIYPAGGWTMDIDSRGHVVGLGRLSEPADMGHGLMTPHGFSDVLVFKLDAMGNLLWARAFGGADSSITAYELAIDPDDNILLTGMFDRALDFGGGMLENRVRPGEANLFAARLDPDGEHLCSSSFGVGLAALTEGRAVAADSAGHMILGGRFNGSVDFGSGPLRAEDRLDAPLYLAKLPK